MRHLVRLRRRTFVPDVARARVSPADIVRDAGKTARSRPGRTVGLGLAIALGVATLVGVLSMSDAADKQVRARIDALRPELVRLSPNVGSENPFESIGADALDRIETQSRVLSAAVVDSYSDGTVRARWGADDQQLTMAPVMGLEGDLVDATRSELDGYGFGERDSRGDTHVALVGGGLARRIGLADPTAQPTIWVEGIPFRVVGVVTDSEYAAATADAVITPRRTALGLGIELLSSTAYVRVERGAADVAAEALPLRLTPNQPERWSAAVPRVALDIAEGISSDLENLSLAMAGLVMFIGVVAIGNAMMRSVYERMTEIGLRRALGARSGHVLGLLVSEAAVVGVVAGVIGVVVGSLVGLAVAQHNHWPMAVSVVGVLLAVPVATTAGALGGLFPALMAVRITPSQALRRE